MIFSLFLLLNNTLYQRAQRVKYYTSKFDFDIKISRSFTKEVFFHGLEFNKKIFNKKNIYLFISSEYCLKKDFELDRVSNKRHSHLYISYHNFGMKKRDILKFINKDFNIFIRYGGCLMYDHYFITVLNSSYLNLFNIESPDSYYSYLNLFSFSTQLELGLHCFNFVGIILCAELFIFKDYTRELNWSYKVLGDDSGISSFNRPKFAISLKITLF